MSNGSAAKKPERAGSIITQHLEGKIVESRYVGPIVFDGSLDRDLARMLEAHPGMHWLVDASGATGIDASRRDMAGDTIGMFRRGGGGTIVAVIPSGPIRMVASALSFGFDLRLKIFSNRPDALAFLRSLP